jgi:hypothetical protein
MRHRKHNVELRRGRQGRGWYLDFTMCGRRIRTYGGTTEDEARQVLDKMRKEKFTELLKPTATSSLIDEVRLIVLTNLKKYVGPALISPELVAPHLHISYRTIYRWLRGSWPITLAHLGRLIEFITRLEAIRESWDRIIRTWPLVLNDDMRVFFVQKFVEILEAPISNEEKLQKLCKTTVALLPIKKEEM